MKPISIVLPVVAACILGAGYLGLRSTLGGSEHVVSRTPSEVELLEKRLQALEERSANSETRIIHLREKVEDKAEDVAPEAVDPSEEPDTVRLEREQRWVEKVETLYEESFQDEPVDPSFAKGMERKLQEATSGELWEHLKATSLTRVECRASLCRAEFEHGTEADQGLLPALFHVPELPEVTIYRRTGEDGKIRSLAYMSAALPRLAQAVEE
jgi:hypothetical protein